MRPDCRNGASDRLDYVNGARLLADDLNDSRAVEARWQELHVRGLHDTWGVATGLALALTSNRRAVRVTPGAAFDCRGRVLALDEIVELPITIAMVPGLLAPTFDIVLGTHGVRWEPTGGQGSDPGYGPGVSFGVDVPLGRFVRSPWGTLSGPDVGHRRVAHPATTPRIGSGVTPAGSLTWSPGSWSVRTVIDVSPTGFTTTPRYVGWLSHAPDLGGLIGPFVSLSSFYPDRFSVQLSALSPAGLPAATVVAALMSASAAVRIAWVGVESFVECGRGTPGGFV